MKSVFIIGGGLSGLSAALNLCSEKSHITILEASPKLGGRAYSFFEPITQSKIDNGQHIMMSCYHDTIEYLSKINALEKIKIQQQLEIIFFNKNRNIFNLTIPPKFYPLNLLVGFLQFKAISLKERIKIVDFFLDLVCCFDEDLQEFSVNDWLKQKKQSDNAIKSFWKILCVGIMNTSIYNASAELFASVLKEIFFTGKNNFQIVLPKVSLSELFIDNAISYFEKTSVKILLNERVIAINKTENGFQIRTNNQIYQNIDYVISSVPLLALNKILGQSNLESEPLPNLEYSPILSMHIWIKPNIFEKDFYGLIDSQIHWIFNHGDYISIVISSAIDFVMLSKEELIKKIICELGLFFPMFSKEHVLNFQIIKEKKATFIPSVDAVKKRKSMNLQINNIYLAGDWTNTGLPGTIEGAIKSGKICAEAVNASVLNNSLNK